MEIIVVLRSRFRFLLIVLLLASAPLVSRSQLVSDGQTAVLDGVMTNVAGNVTIGTNGGFTLLVITNGAAVTNDGTVSLGLNFTATSNRVALGAGSVWNNSGNSFNIGYSGSFNELDIVGGATVTNVYGYIGYQAPGSNNTVMVSDPGSLWQSTYVYEGQSGGANNRLVITNGASVVSSSAVLGTGFGQNNSAIVTGANSLWTNVNSLVIGAYASNSVFIVTNGGAVFSGTSSGLGMLGSAGVSNLAVVTGAGSAWTIAGSFYVGRYSSGNELDILNGGQVADTTGYLGGPTNNLVVVSGAGSVWTNNSVHVGYNGPRNSLVITNGGQVDSVSTSYISGEPSSSNNTVVISGTGSAWNGGYIYLGYSSPGGNRLAINNGGAMVSSIDQGVYCNSNLLTVADAGSSLRCLTLGVGYMSTGNECVVSNGATLAVLGTAPTQIEGHSTRMTITGAGTLWTNLGELNFGQYSNVLCITGGATLVDDHATIENGMSYPNFSPNMEIVAGTNSLWNNHGNFYMTDTGGQLFVTNGGTLSDDYGYFGDAYSSSPDSNCIATVSGPGSLWTNQADFYIGYDGSSNQVIVNDSGKLNAQTAYVGYNGNGNQLVVSDSGVITVRGLNIGTAVNSKSNSVVLSGGTITVTTFSTSLIQYGTLTINSGLFTAVLTGTDVSGPIGSKIMLHGGTFQSAGTSYRNPAPFAVGDGTDAATYEMLFTTSQNGGTHSFSGGLSVSSNGLVKGFGTIAANVSVNDGGVIAPGATNLGTIVVKGNATLNPGSTTVMKLDASSGASDSLTGATNLVYGGTLQLTNISAALTAGKSFKLFGATNYLGAFSNLNPTAPGAGLRWDTNELNVDGTLRVFSSTTPAPTLGNIVMANGNLTVSAIGGIPFDPCYLLTSTNLTDWSSMATNYFDASGAASFTNAVAPAEPQQYFRVQVN